jgi:hypothetical protein
MIKVIYEHVCDGCSNILDSEIYNCTDIPELELPRPHRMYSFIYRGLNVQLCRECATPMYNAVDLMKEKVTCRRAEQEARGK